ncbi:CLUMA_CG012793, isoform A [Clunio marinus]|uniref:CLUMA_CG012793, isoform A n=1 Tax=Clunio marinus TaxID=568069 RepID=A0A1J1IGI4_9DIPT|nr:CLUMA_CG012793, isoform A [Clunio marinus]
MFYNVYQVEYTHISFGWLSETTTTTKTTLFTNVCQQKKSRKDTRNEMKSPHIRYLDANDMMRKKNI